MGNTKKYTYEYIKEYIKSLGYSLLSKEYINNSTKLTIKDYENYIYTISFANLLKGRKPQRFHISNDYSIYNLNNWIKINKSEYDLLSDKYTDSSAYITLRDKAGYYYYIITRNFIYNSNQPTKFHKTNPYTIYNIKLWCNINSKNFELISNDYAESHKNLTWKCNNTNCKETFSKTWADISQNQGCPFCLGQQVGISNCLATKNSELTKEWHPTKNGDITPYDVTENSGKKVWWKCIKEHEWESTIDNRSKGVNCPYCSGRAATYDNNLLIVNPTLCEEWNYNYNKNKPDMYLPKSNKKVWWICKECGHEWKTSICSRSNGNGCPECNKSKGEKRVKKYLESSNINFIQQIIFDDLIGLGSGNLSYDFYLPDYHLLIEYQGQFHDGTAFQQTEEEFKYQQEHDRRKSEYAIKNNIRLLEIWYWDFDNIETILKQELNI
jgi:hypothetical protein